jgi:nicotinamide-nucleotide amidase
MFLHEVLPRLDLPTSHFHVRTFKTFGMGESAVAERLGDWTASANPSVATYAKADGVWVRVAAKAENPERAAQVAEPAEAHVQSELRAHIWGEDGDDLPSRVLERLRTVGGSLAVLEHGSAGRLGSVLSDAASDDRTFRGSVIAWTPQAYSTTSASESARPSGVPTSEQEVAAAARDVRIRFAATHGVAVGKTRPAPAGDAFETVLAVADERDVVTQTLRLPGLGSDWLRERLCYSALHRLWSQLNDTTIRVP